MDTRTVAAVLVAVIVVAAAPAAIALTADYHIHGHCAHQHD